MKKNKVVSLYANNDDKNKNDEDIIYADLLKKLVAPYKNKVKKTHTLEELYSLGFQVWNLSNFKAIFSSEEYERLISNAPIEEEDRALFVNLIEDKIKKFGDYPNFLRTISFDSAINDPFMSLESVPPKDYLEELSTYEESMNWRAEFDENYINRQALILKPKQPFMNWVNKISNDFQDFWEDKIFLIDEELDFEPWLEFHFPKIFETELSDWTDDARRWPKRRTYKVFKEWFHVDFTTLVYDYECKPVKKIGFE